MGLRRSNGGFDCIGCILLVAAKTSNECILNVIRMMIGLADVFKEWFPRHLVFRISRTYLRYRFVMMAFTMQWYWKVLWQIKVSIRRHKNDVILIFLKMLFKKCVFSMFTVFLLDVIRMNCFAFFRFYCHLSLVNWSVASCKCIKSQKNRTHM